MQMKTKSFIRQFTPVALITGLSLMTVMAVHADDVGVAIDDSVVTIGHWNDVGKW